MHAGIDPQELAHELECTRAAEKARAAFFASGPALPRWRDVQVVAASTPSLPGLPGTGRSLISRRPPTRQRRYERIIAEERTPANSLDYKLQICWVSTVMEEEINDLLAEPLRPSAGLLASAVRAAGAGKDGERTAGFLDRWGSGQEPTTLGLVTMGLLVAIRRALSQDEAEFSRVLDRAFTPELVAAIRENWLGPTLDQLRMTRNASCHPGGEFDEPAYRQFVSRLVGHRGLMEWERDGAVPAPPAPDSGFLHRLLTGSRLLPPVELPPAGTALDRLTALSAPRPDAFGLEIVPYAPKPGRRFRDITVEAVRDEPGFRLGGELVLRVRAERDCRLTLIDVGTSGAISLLLPNALCPVAVLRAGVTAHFPGPGFADFTFRLGGMPGRERMIALATTSPLPSLPTPGIREPFSRLTPSDLERIAQVISRQPADQWSAAACEFTIEA